MSTVRFLRSAQKKLEPRTLSDAELLDGNLSISAETDFASFAGIAALPDRAVGFPRACFEQENVDESELSAPLLFSSPAAEQGYAGKLVWFPGNEFYTQAILHCAESTYLVWIRIDVAAAWYVLTKRRMPNRTCWGSLATMLETDLGAAGLFCMVECRDLDSSPFPQIQQVVNTGSPFPIAANAVISAAFRPRRQCLELEQKAQSASTTLDRRAFSGHEYSLCSRSQFALGWFAEAQGDIAAAISYYNRSALLDHPRGFEQELRCHSIRSLALRKKYPAVFEAIRIGDSLSTLTVLRQAAIEFPLSGNAILSYVLRGSNEVQEGIQAAENALALEPLQNDVLGNRYHFLLQQGRYQELQETACLQLLRYPQDPGAMSNLADAYSLLGFHQEAKIQCERYACFASNADMLIHQLSKTHEAADEWQPLAERLREILAVAPNPSIHSLIYIAEAFTEIFSFEEAELLLFRALELKPGYGPVLLALARLLARSGQESAAENLLRTAVSDTNRSSTLRDDTLLLTLLAEILRRTERCSEALAVFETMFPAPPLELVAQIGPLPALEYAETLLELGEIERCKVVVDALQRDFPDNPFVRDISRLLS